MARGVAYRVIYDDEAFQQGELREEIYGAVEAGEHSRVLAGVPSKILIADEGMGIIAPPRPGGEPEVVIIQPGMLLETLIEAFELLWRLSIDVAVPPGANSPRPRSRPRRRVRCCGGLAAGPSDEAINRELGLSERTVYRRIRRLQDLLAARSRFQLGIQAMRRGWH